MGEEDYSEVKVIESNCELKVNKYTRVSSWLDIRAMCSYLSLVVYFRSSLSCIQH